MSPRKRRHGDNAAPRAKPPKGDVIEAEGFVVEVLPNTLFKVRLPEHKDHMVLAHLSGKGRINHIRVILGDRVKVELSPYDLTRGRITYRMK